MRTIYKSTCYCTNLRRSAGIISDYYDRGLKEVGLTAAQYYLLINLSRLGVANITSWARQVGLERSTMVRNIRILEANALVELSPDASGYGKIYQLSPHGQEVLAVARPTWQRIQEEMEAFLGEDYTRSILLLEDRLQELSQSGSEVAR